MNNSSFKVKYFKDTIIGLKAVLTYCSSNKEYENKSGTIMVGNKTNRFFLALDDGKTIVKLNEEDELQLIVEE